MSEENKDAKEGEAQAGLSFFASSFSCGRRIAPRPSLSNYDNQSPAEEFAGRTVGYRIKIGMKLLHAAGD